MAGQESERQIRANNLQALATYAVIGDKDAGRNIASNMLSAKYGEGKPYESIADGFYDMVGIALKLNEQISQNFLPLGKVTEGKPAKEPHPIANDTVATTLMLTGSFDLMQGSGAFPQTADALLASVTEAYPFVSHETMSEVVPEAPFNEAELLALWGRYEIPSEIKAAIELYVSQRVDKEWPALDPYTRRELYINPLMTVAATAYALFRRGPNDLGEKGNLVGAKLPPYTPRRERGAEAQRPSDPTLEDLRLRRTKSPVS